MFLKSLFTLWYISSSSIIQYLCTSKFLSLNKLTISTYSCLVIKRLSLRMFKACIGVSGCKPYFLLTTCNISAISASAITIMIAYSILLNTGQLTIRLIDSIGDYVFRLHNIFSNFSKNSLFTEQSIPYLHRICTILVLTR